MRMGDQQRARTDTVFAAHLDWQRGAISEREYLRRADLTDTEHAAIERGLDRYSPEATVLVQIANTLFPAGGK